MAESFCKHTLFCLGGRLDPMDYNERFLRAISDASSDAYNYSVESLVDVPFTRQSSCDAVAINDFYLILRKRISQLRRKKPNADFRRENVDAVKDTVQLLRTFLQHLIRRIQCLKKYDSASSHQDFQVVTRCWKFLKGLLIRFGPLLDEGSGTGLSLGSHTRSECAQIALHAHLELFALTFLAAREVEKLFPQFVPELCNDIIWIDRAPLDPVSVSRHIGNLIVENLMRFTAMEYGKMQRSNWIQYLTCGPFPCSCFVDLFCLLQSQGDQPSPNGGLVLIMNQAIQFCQRASVKDSDDISRSDVMVLPSFKQSGNDVPDFLLWFTNHIVTSSRQMDGLQATTKNMPLEKLLAGRILQPVLTNLDSVWNEPKARYLVTCLHRVQTVTGPQTESLVLLLDFFFRHINESYSLISSSVEGMLMIPETPFQWMTKWASIDAVQNQAWVLNSSDTSFDLFLRSLVSTFRSGSDTWKRAKGRLLSKLHSRFFETLSMAGWTRIFDMALILTGRTTDQTDFSHYFCEVALDSGLASTASINKTKVIWRGFLAVIAMCRQQGRDFSALARKLAGEFDSFCRHCKNSRQDLSVANLLWTVALVYLESWDGLLTSQPESVHLVGILLSSGISDLFIAFPDESKTGKLCTLLEDILSRYFQSFPDWQDRITSPSSASHLPFLKNILVHVLPSIKRLALQRGGRFLDHVSCVAFNCTVIGWALESAVVGHAGDPPTALFQYFAMSDEVSPLVTASYLLQLMQKPDVLGRFRKDDSFDGVLLHIWVRCVIELGEDKDDVRALSAEMLKLPEISCFNMSNFGPTSLFQTFVEKCGLALNDQLSYGDRMTVQRRYQVYFSDLHKYVGNVVRLATSGEQVDWAVGLVGWILECCVTVLYIRAKLNSVLRQVADVVLFGTENALVTHSMQAHLPCYCRALAKLDFQNDPQIREMLSTVIRNFMLKFGSLPPDQHPLLTGLRTSVTIQPRICGFAIGVIFNSFIIHVPVPHNAALAVSFLIRLVASVPPALLPESLEVLFASGLEVFLRGNDRTRIEAMQLISQSLGMYRTNPSEKTKNSLASLLREKCLAVMQSQPANMFLLLNSIAGLCPVLLREMMPFLTQVCSGKLPSYPMYQNAKARESYAALQRKMEQAGFA